MIREMIPINVLFTLGGESQTGTPVCAQRIHNPADTFDEVRAVVVIGFANLVETAGEAYDLEANSNEKYWNGSGKWGKTAYYKNIWYCSDKKKTSKGQFSYLRLK